MGGAKGAGRGVVGGAKRGGVVGGPKPRRGGAKGEASWAGLRGVALWAELRGGEGGAGARTGLRPARAGGPRLRGPRRCPPASPGPGRLARLLRTPRPASLAPRGGVRAPLGPGEEWGGGRTSERPPRAPRAPSPGGQLRPSAPMRARRSPRRPGRGRGRRPVTLPQPEAHPRQWKSFPWQFVTRTGMPGSWTLNPSCPETCDHELTC